MNERDTADGRTEDSLKKTRSGAAHAVSQQVGESKRDLQGLMDAMEELLGSVTDQAGDKMAQARRKAESVLSDVRGRASAAGEDLMARTSDAAACTEGYVRANPWRALGMAAGVGFVLALLLKRR